MIKTLRTIHFWLGTLFAPSLIFFAVSGAFQLYDLHEDGPGWIQTMAQVHKIQSLDTPKRRPPRPTPPPEAPGARAQPERPRPPSIARSATAKLYFLLMAIALVVSSVLGLIMAFTYKRDRRILFGLLVIGTILPIVLLKLA